MHDDDYDDDPSEPGDDPAEKAMPRYESELPAVRPRYFAFYDRLRARIVAFIERRGRRLSPAVANALLLVPDVFVLMARLMMDKEVPARTRALIGGALAYFVLPVDLLPEAMAGPAGFIDDLILALAVLAQSFGDELEPLAAKYWSGSQSLRRVLADILGTADSLVGADLFHRLRRAHARRGIDLDEAQDAALPAADDVRR